MTCTDKALAQECVANALATGPECIRLDRLDEPLTPGELEHLAGCPRCATERELWQQINIASPLASEGSGTQWIVAELRRRRSAEVAGSSRGSVSRWIQFRQLAIAALVVATTMTGYLAWDPVPALNVPPAVTAPNYRTLQLRLLEPAGDLPVAPRALKWEALEQAAEYHVALLEVDGTVLWQGSSSEPVIALPSAVIAALVPGKSVVWRVRATDASGATLGKPADQRFRVVP